MTNALACILTFLAAVAVDFASTKYVLAVEARCSGRAAFWSVLQWGAASVGFIFAVKVSMLVLPFEAGGLALGTWLGLRHHKDPVSSVIPEARVVKKPPGFVRE